MIVHIIDGTDYVVINKLENCVPDIRHGYLKEELGYDFQKHLYTLTKEEYENKVAESKERPDEEHVGKKVDRFVVGKPIRATEEEEFEIKIDRKNNNVDIKYIGVARVRGNDCGRDL